MSNFKLIGLDHMRFAQLFDQPDASLESRGIVRTRATECPGFPCRISLEDAAVGEELLLLPFWHHEVQSPYRSLGPIYVRRGVRQAVLRPGVVPEYVSRRLISLRAYNADLLMAAADVCDGTRVAARLEELFADPAISYIHLHNAKQGCFSCVAHRP